MKKLLKDPLLHFLVIGAALFLFFEIFSGPDETADTTIRITRGDIEALTSNFTRTWQRKPTESEMEGLIEEQVREEIAYREAQALGLDQNDAYIKRRLRMKMELLLEDIGTLDPPTDEELSAFLMNNKASFSVEPQVSFSQIYFSPDKQGNTLEENIRDVMEQLSGAGPGVRVEDYGDTIMLPSVFPLSSISTINRQFGARFTEALVDLEPDSWQGPIRSGYGWHLVLIDTYEAGYDPDLGEVRSAVERELMAKRRKDIKEELYKKLRERYQVEIVQESASGE